MSDQSPQSSDSSMVTARRKPFAFSIGSMLVITFVVAIVGMLAGRMAMAARSGDNISVGLFAIVAALAPTAALVGAGMAFRVIQRLQRR